MTTHKTFRDNLDDRLLIADAVAFFVAASILLPCLLVVIAKMAVLAGARL